MQHTRTHWPSILLLVAISLGVLVLITAALATAVGSMIELFHGFADPAGTMIKSVSYGFETVLLLLSAWFILQKAGNREAADQNLKFPFPQWQVYVIPVAILLALSLGGVIAILEINWLAWILLPVLTLVVVILPVLLILGLGTNGMDFGPSWRVWGTISISITISPILMVFAELMVLGLFVLFAAINLSAEPGAVMELGQVVRMLNQEISEEAVVSLLKPYLTRPATISAIFLFLSLIVPLIEELFKPLAVWLFARNIAGPANGFALGLLSGGVFALVESFNVSGNGSTAWFVILGVRLGTSLLHMTASGLMGYAIVELIQFKKIGRFLLTYLVVTLLHGLWNACAAGTILATVGEYLDRPQWIWNLPAALSGFIILAGGMFLVLITSNRKIRAELSRQPEAQLEKIQEGSKIT